MAHRSHVPKFGNWENRENEPYTAFFDKARKGRGGGKMINPNDPEENPDIGGGKMINPNDPEENPDILSSDSMAPAQAPPPLPPRPQADPEEPKGHGTVPVRPVHERKISNEGNPKQFATDSPSRPTSGAKHQLHGARGASSGSGDQSHKSVVRGSAGSDHSIERSPIHQQARISGRGSSSPSWEGRAARDNIHGTPGRSRFSGASRGDELLDKGSTVPKFGEWDENDPTSADGYTHIFNQVREERHTGGRNGPGYAESPYRPAGGKKAQSSGWKICCFPWGGK
ncbi:RPM1-interacting protein 4-like isoform X2 [Punica granatum]|uniref:RIN4 pathogenic type III effector avirulence factor Avr cleavage site domain-containing protein n=2 Tax=Punica granatum TaxID=22663 RepID=A0A218XD69_PUNGR|nr:RPM1-interacting protein 4-like isoform X2 [Punica granatum]OWM82897.1 hypothetical protein CDL15_Pgr005297 [Punica granatum]PKI64818.1 hypothetical protein CRG98_014814 [Punica granatum]